jgi:hypothetical protein
LKTLGKSTRSASARGRSRRSTRGRGRRVTRRRAATPQAVHVDPAAVLSDAVRPVTSTAEPAHDESLYQLGDGSDLPTIDVRADVETAEA